MPCTLECHSTYLTKASSATLGTPLSCNLLYKSVYCIVLDCHIPVRCTVHICHHGSITMPGGDLQGFELDPDHWQSEQYVRQVGMLGQWEATGRAVFRADPRNAAAAAASLNRPDRAGPSSRKLQQKQPKRDRCVHKAESFITSVVWCRSLTELLWCATSVSLEFIVLHTWHVCQV